MRFFPKFKKITKGKIRTYFMTNRTFGIHLLFLILRTETSNRTIISPMKRVTHFATLLAALSLMAASSSCSSMLTSLSESISQLNDQLASNLSENPQSTQPQATTKATSAQTSKAAAPAAKPTKICLQFPFTTAADGS